ncbi:hypothetical protein THAOC_21650 [Thalassiosira oceanica]|uniref:DUF6820 domain-containing protein n=1 Tax=Thalassiosira oceanica TaxID=159749 RepID=K0S0P7_THAOC|nr:hypothetical protein THAOC_21650 [Thalassiosira oceanica]|eukprot:EJK58244.1 hypothetical protein THAOC_21650 [Thalassiosira oceanica]
MPMTMPDAVAPVTSVDVLGMPQLQSRWVGDANCSSTTSLHRTAVGNIESRLIDEFTPGLSSIPYPTSVAAGFYRNDIIKGSRTSAGRARAMMSEFAVAPAAHLIDDGGRRAIGIALRPQHFKGDVLGMNRCPWTMEELDSPYRRCAGRADRDRQGQSTHLGKVGLGPESAARPLSGPVPRFSFGRLLHAEIVITCLPILALSSI